ncbi:actinobacterial surface-anchored domain protein [Clostridium argentinense CDC 2741]|uniref:Actinobacterial surface-anchored domain protein n=1 Tax=Clostridium argentinense CDC 2741 TaxID=1418104 RepID=A0A0C1UHE3_9CLOT|nr:hemoblobin-interacting domain-containing protein [Clostridium argentinense]ARC86577.1 hypothetical protein RSJ17_19835 [Clostridium argentinense]KIE46805.1 actinobacterial surface-anchored domain protein [Clostridium argentinense CDC 2741]NFF38043.1 DUF1533 domain-containing protein [Clostridium argentinense]NFP50025.1 DUF1533 domain-containing protein [Clostridium argentinense]NFP71435.1 DUF1533 domain-containing protein [Clostridium argentinense]
MNKNSKILYAIVFASFASSIHSGVALAAPSEIYGYKKMDLFEFHKTNYDKYGNIRYSPETTTFSTGKDEKDLDNSTSASARINSLKNTKAYSQKAKVDAVAHASSSGSSDKVDAVGSASGGFVGADVVFDFDMLSNALILKQLGYDIPEVNKVLDIFNTTTRTHIGKRGEIDFLVDYEDYMAKAGEAYYNDEYLSFEEYIKSGNYKENLNRPYYLKYVLEDGLYGEQMKPEEVYKKTSPKVVVDLENNIKGNTITLKFKDNKEWRESIELIELVENYNRKPLTNYIEIKDSEIKINTEIFKYGKNTISIKSKDYRTILIDQPIYKGKVNLTVDNNNILGNDVIVRGGDKSYIESLKTIIVNGNSLSKDKWKINEDNNMIISKEMFSQSGIYNIILKADPEYVDSKLSISVIRKTSDKVILHEDIINNFEGNTIEIFIENYSERWKENIKEIEVGKYKYTAKEISIENGKFILPSELFKGQNGKVDIKVTLKDETEYLVVQNIYKSNESLKVPELTSKRVELGQDIIINFNKNTKFQNSIYKIEKVYSENIPSLNTQLEYIVQNGKIILKHNSRTFGNNGAYKVRVFATGYEPKDVNIELIKNPPTVLLPAPPTIGEEFMIQVSRTTPEYNWGDNVKEVYVDGKVLQKDLHYTSNIGGVYFKGGAINYPGEHLIKIVSTGYKDYEVALRFKDINGNLSDKNQVENVKFNENLILGENLEIISTDKNWVNGIYEVKINDSVISKNNYRFENSELIIDNYVVTNLGKNKISIKSINYKKAEFEVNVINDHKLLNPPTLKEDIIDNTASKEIEITFEDNKAWRESIEYILIDGNKFSKNDVHVESGKIIIPSGVLTEGKRKIVIVSKGYNNAALTQKISKVVPENIKLMPSIIKPGQNTTINYAYREGYSVEEVYINGEKIDTEKYAEKTLFGDLRLKGELFSKAGQYSIVIKSSEFVDKEFSLEVKGGKTEVEDGLKNPGNIKLMSEVINSNDKADVWIGYMSEYEPTKILVNEKEIDMTKDYEKQYTGGIFIKNVFSKAGEYKIVLKADGYRDVEVNLTVIDNENESNNSDIIEDKNKEEVEELSNQDIEKTLKDVPSNINLMDSIINVNGKATIYVGYMSEYEPIKVLVNEKEIDMTKDYEKQHIGNLYIKNVFDKAGEYKIILRADGYKDTELNLTVK